MGDSLRSELLGTAGLTVAAAAALLLAVFRRPLPSGEPEHERMRTTFVVLLLLQALHAVEEYATRFHVRFPEALGLAPWSGRFFLILNLTWLAVWVAAGPGLRTNYRPAFFPAWFLAMGGMANGVGHPLLALQSGGYFPGLATSPLVGVGGLLLWRRLVASTAVEATRPGVRRALLFVEAIAFTVLVPGTVTVLIPQYLGVWGDLTPEPWTASHVVALAPLSLGLAIYVRCVWEFATRGRGIPAPVDHPKQLVVTGLYRYVRNPMYVGVMFFMVGQSLFFQSIGFLGFTIVWFLWVHVNVLLYEEPNLRRRFGDSYASYTAAVNRWVPGRAYYENL